MQTARGDACQCADARRCDHLMLKLAHVATHRAFTTDAASKPYSDVFPGTIAWPCHYLSQTGRSLSIQFGSGWCLPRKRVAMRKARSRGLVFALAAAFALSSSSPFAAPGKDKAEASGYEAAFQQRLQEVKAETAKKPKAKKARLRLNDQVTGRRFGRGHLV